MHIVQAPQRQRWGRGRHERFGLPAQPAVVHTEYCDVFKNHVQQLQQAGADGGLILRGKREPVGEVAEHELHGRQRRIGLAQEGDELRRHVVHPGIVFAQRWQRVVNQPRECLGKVSGKNVHCRRFAHHRRGRHRAEPQVGVAHQHALQCRPVFGGDGSFKLGEKPFLPRGLRRQHALDAA